jgi:hypothetical protein
MAWKTVVTTLVASLVVTSYAESTYDHAIRLMEASPLIDTHIDLPQILRSLSTVTNREDMHRTS